MHHDSGSARSGTNGAAVIAVQPLVAAHSARSTVEQSVPPPDSPLLEPPLSVASIAVGSTVSSPDSSVSGNRSVDEPVDPPLPDSSPVEETPSVFAASSPSLSSEASSPAHADVDANRESNT